MHSNYKFRYITFRTANPTVWHYVLSRSISYSQFFRSAPHVRLD